MLIAVVSDIHANLTALEAVLADAGDVGGLWCLGDVVGYGPQPNECVQALQAWEPRLVCIAGNHDWASLGHLDTADFNADAERAALWTREHLALASYAWLKSLPQRESRVRFTLVHGTPREPIWEYLVSPAAARDNFAILETPYCFVGHSHLPFICREGEQNNAVFDPATPRRPVQLDEQRAFINPGSVGQPRDGNPDASYLILDDERQTVEHRRVAYDIALTQQLMSAAHLPERLINRLSHGW